MSKLLNCLINKDTSCVPIWFMRQAGRYCKIQTAAGTKSNFLKLCLNSKLATGVATHEEV